MELFSLLFNNNQQFKIFLTIAVTVLIFLIYKGIRTSLKRIQLQNKLVETRYFAMKKVLSITSTIIYIITLSSIWGINFHTIWGAISGILVMVAVGFIAVWSILSNILAGVMLYFTTPFKIKDRIEIAPDGICGQVLAINTIYTLLIDDEGAYISVPNSLFFQKYIRRLKKGS